MRITALTQNSKSRDATSCTLAWYIVMKKHKILFITGEAESFFRYADMVEIPMDEIDMLFLPQGCGDSIRELEYFLIHNNNSKIYLSRTDNENHLRSIYNKLIPYAEPERILQWEKRTIFMDEVMNIGDEVRVFSKGSHRDSYSQNMIICEDKVWVLFVNDSLNEVEFVQTIAESISGHHMNYLFCSGEYRECIMKNCIEAENADMELRGEVCYNLL